MEHNTQIALLALMAQAGYKGLLNVPGVADACMEYWSEPLRIATGTATATETTERPFSKISVEDVATEADFAKPANGRNKKAEGVLLKDIIYNNFIVSNLKEAGYERLSDVAGVSEDRLRQIRHVGEGTIMVLKDALEEHNLPSLT